MEDDDEAIPKVPPVTFERLVAESEFLGTVLEMPPDDIGPEYRAVMSRNSQRLELALWRSQYRTLALLRQRDIGSS